MSLAKFSCELEHVDAFVVFYAGERFRTESFLGEKIEPSTPHPIMHHCVRARVSSKTRPLHLQQNDSAQSLTDSSPRVLVFTVYQCDCVTFAAPHLPLHTVMIHIFPPFYLERLDIFPTPFRTDKPTERTHVQTPHTS